MNSEDLDQGLGSWDMKVGQASVEALNYSYSQRSEGSYTHVVLYLTVGIPVVGCQAGEGCVEEMQAGRA
jgi:hypothetical protein